jgi:hypothetical protein
LTKRNPNNEIVQNDPEGIIKPLKTFEYPAKRIEGASLDVLRRLEPHVRVWNRLHATEQATQLPCPRFNLLDWAQVWVLDPKHNTMPTYDAKFSRMNEDKRRSTPEKIRRTFNFVDCTLNFLVDSRKLRGSFKASVNLLGVDSLSMLLVLYELLERFCRVPL